MCLPRDNRVNRMRGVATKLCNTVTVRGAVGAVAGSVVVIGTAHYK